LKIDDPYRFLRERTRAAHRLVGVPGGTKLHGRILLRVTENQCRHLAVDFDALKKRQMRRFPPLDATG
jgi:hypothetical protein